MTIYVVTSGSYSDYGIEGMFSDKEKAAAYVSELRRHKTSENADIEEWELDANCDKRWIEVWDCCIILGSGCIMEHPERSYDFRKPFRGVVRSHDVPYHDGRVSRVQSGVSAEHCLKLAAEVRQRWLRSEALEKMQQIDVEDSNGRI